MAKYLPYGGVTFGSQGSNLIQERVKHFSSFIDFDELQEQINAWLFFISSQVIGNRPAIRTINFLIMNKPEQPNKGFQYFAQVHYMLIGDADDDINIG